MYTEWARRPTSSQITCAARFENQCIKTTMYRACARMQNNKWSSLIFTDNYPSDLTSNKLTAVETHAISSSVFVNFPGSKM